MEMISIDVIHKNKLEKLSLICDSKNNNDPRFGSISCEGSRGNSKFSLNIDHEKITILDKKRMNQPNMIILED